jgi:GntR family transcriptional regulator
MASRARRAATTSPKDEKLVGALPTRVMVASVLQRAGRLDRRSSVPLWIQTKEKLSAAVQRVELPPHTPLPSELDLCAIFDVSRPVIRAALEAMTAEGLLVKENRRGAFIAQRKTELDFATSNIGLFGEMIAKGRKVSTKLIELVKRAPDEHESMMLRLRPGNKIVHVRRVYLVDGQPMATGGISLPAHKVPGLENLNLANRSLNTMVRDVYGIVVARSERWLEAVLPNVEQASALELTTGTPVISIESIGWMSDGTPIEYYNAVYSTREQRIHLTIAANNPA